MDSDEWPKLGAAGARAVESPEFANLTGTLQRKCFDEALRERVRQELKWDKPPTAGFLEEEIRNHLTRAKAAALAPPPVKPARRALEDPVKTKSSTSPRPTSWATSRSCGASCSTSSPCSAPRRASRPSRRDFE